MPAYGMSGYNTLTINTDAIAAVKGARQAAYKPCQHPRFYAIRKATLDGEGDITAWACTGCSLSYTHESMREMVQSGQIRREQITA